MEETITFGRFRLLPQARALYSGDERVKIGSRALEILLVLVEQAGDLVKKQDLVARAWPGMHVEDGALRVHISALRKVLGDNPDAPQYIFNSAGQGYRFVAPTALLLEETTSNPAPSFASTAGAHAIGREAAIRRVIASLQQTRFVTITGPGGIGKTTVAQAAADRMAAEYFYNKKFVDLAPLSDPQALPSALALALRLRISSENATGELIAWLTKQRMLLLLLDSCEHLIDAVAALCEQIAAAAPDIHVLTTSREPLRVAGEWVTRLSPLELPQGVGAIGWKEALKSSAVMLFVERARAAEDTFSLCEDNSATIADICRRLDGIPLAIEFAAARIGAFGAKELLARLDDRFALLRSGKRTAIPRQRTLRATLDWSHELLPPAEQMLLRRLAAFSGSFTLDAVQTCLSSPNKNTETLLDGVANLVAKSLLNIRLEQGETRYRLLETTRAFAMEKLEESGEAPGLARRIAEYLNTLFETAEREITTASSRQWNDRYGYMIDDIRAALDGKLSNEADAAVAIALTASSSPAWFSLGLLSEYRVRARHALHLLKATKVEAPAAEMRLNISLASATFNTDGPLNECVSHYATALDIATKINDADHQLRALWGLATQHFIRGDYIGALVFCERLDRLVEQSGDRAAAIVRDRIMALGLHLVGRQAEARQYAARAAGQGAALVHSAHEIFEQYDNRVAARSHLSRILWIQGFPDQASALAREGVDHALSLDYSPPLCYIIAFAAFPIAFWTGDLTAARHYLNVLRAATAGLSFQYWHSWYITYELVLDLTDEAGPDKFSEVLPRFRDVVTRPAYGNVIATFRAELAGSEAFIRAEDGSAGWCAPEILRAHSLALLRQAGTRSVADATTLLHKSLGLSRQQGALSWELRSATSLARLQHDNKDSKAARETLRPVYERFSEGFETRDLLTAAALLADLEA